MEAERRRRERLAQMLADRQQGQIMFTERLNGISALSDGGESLKVSLHPMYVP